MRRALAYVRREPQLRAVFTVVAIVSTVGFNFHVLVPLLAGGPLHVGPEGFGLLSASFGLGALVGALVTATFRDASWKLFATGATGFGVLALALAPVVNAVLAGVLLFAVGISFTLFTANANALVQLGAPDHLRGRMIGLYLFAFVGLAPLGGLLTGWLAELAERGSRSPSRGDVTATIGVASLAQSHAGIDVERGRRRPSGLDKEGDEETSRWHSAPRSRSRRWPGSSRGRR